MVSCFWDFLEHHRIGFINPQSGAARQYLDDDKFPNFWCESNFIISTLYHASKEPQKRFKLKVFDHAAIYVLIAGSYTPFTLVSLNGETGWLIFSMVWVMAFTGIILKLFFTGKFKIVSTAMYVLMGWLIVFYFQDLTASLHEKGVFYLILGGVLYTIGAILYSIKKIKFNHAIFHFFVLAGSFCHFLSIYLYV